MSAPRATSRLLGRHGADSEVAWTSGKVTTATELLAHVAGFAALLPPTDGGEEVAILCRDRYRFVVAMLAAWQRGYAVALPPNSQVETIASLRLRPGVRTVVHDRDGVDKGIDVRDAQVVEAARGQVGRLPFAPWAPLAPGRHLATVYTSGSTGEHLACAKTTEQLLGEAAVLVETFGVAVGSRVLPMVPNYHIYGLLFGALVPLLSGGSFCRQTPLHAHEVAAALQARVDILVSVPAHLRGLLLAKEGELPPLSRVFSSAAPLPPRVAQKITERFGWRITEVFGSSETGGIGWRESGGDGPWKPFPGVSVEVAPDGRMLLDSPFLPGGAPRPHVAADRIERLEDGRFLHLGRADGVLKIAGVRVSIAEVERRLGGISGVEDAAVVSVAVDGPRGHEIWAAVVAPTLDVAALRAALLEWLAPVAMPRRLRIVERLPRGEHGKLTRHAMLAVFGRDHEPTSEPT